MAESTAAAGWWPRTTARPTRHGAYWQQIVLSRVALVRAELERADGPAAGIRDRVEELLATAELAAREPGARLRLWLGGGAINRAFVSLHAAQVLLARCGPDDHLAARLDTAMARVRSTMPPTPRRDCLEDRYAALVTAGPERDADRRWLLERALDWSYATTDAQYARLRSFRNVLSGVSISMLVLLGWLVLMGARWPDSLRLCFVGSGGYPVCPTGAYTSSRDALVIAVLGAAGGALAAVLSVSRMQGTATPYSVPLALAMLKLPVGALTALLGLLMIHGRFVPGLDNLDTSGQILAYAIVLGVAQHAVTSFVDRRGQELLSGIPAKPSTARPARS